MSARAVYALAILGTAARAGVAQGIALPQPVASPAAPFVFPNIKTHTLPNGLRLLVGEDHSVGVVAVRIVFRTDSSTDPVGKEGLAAVAIGALGDGTTSQTTDQLARRSMAIGTAVSPTSFTTTTASFESALALMSDMLVHPAFDQTAIDARNNAQAARARSLDQSTVTAPQRIFFGTLYGWGDGFPRTRFPTVNAAPITRNDVLAFYRENIVPSATTIIITGDVTDARALSAVKKMFGAWPSGSTASAPVARAMYQSPGPTTIYLNDAPGTSAYVFVGGLGPRRDSPDAAIIDLLSAVATRRFTQRLRDERSLIYAGGLGFAWEGAARPSALLGSTIVVPQKADTVLMEWFGVMRGLLGDVPLSDAEVENAKRSLLGALPARIDGPDRLAARLADLVHNGQPADYLDAFAKDVSAATPSQVSATARKYIDMQHLIVVVSGDRTIIEPALRAANLAPIVLIDAHGKPVAR